MFAKQIRNFRPKVDKLYRAYTPQRLHVYDAGEINSVSGIRATIFGGTSFMGSIVGSKLGLISSDLVFPLRGWDSHFEEVKELKLCANLGYAWLVRNMNFHDDRMIDRVCSHSNVVVNLTGPRKRYKTQKQFEEVNIDLPKRLAKAAARNPDIIRFIHFSAVGASPDSPSMDLRTKYYGEQEVLEHFPNATIIRPTTVIGRDDYFINDYHKVIESFYNKFYMFSDGNELRQPIYVDDVAQCVLNSLKMHETCGKIYEIGGPYVYSRLECYEIMMNALNRRIHHVKFDNSMAQWVAERILNWRYFSKEDIIKQQLDLVVDPKANNINDLFVTPVSFSNIVTEILGPYAVLNEPTMEDMES